MNRRRATWSTLASLITALVLATGAHAAGAAAPVSVTLDHTQISTELGGKFAFRSTITNRSATAADGLIAHLNVLSLRDGVSVDPEDWSSQRTHYLSTIPAGGSTTISWSMQAVNAGSFGVYVAVISPPPSVSPPTTGKALHIAVAERRTLNPGGILPLALGIPALLGLLILGLRLRSRTSRDG